MKKVTLLYLAIGITLGALSASSQANYFEQALSGDKSGFYIGLDYWNDTRVKLEQQSENAEPSGDVSPFLGIYVGVNTQVVDSFYIGYELAYQVLGNDRIDVNEAFRDSYLEEEFDAGAILLSVKPKYYLPESNFYIAGKAGLGYFYMDQRAVSRNRFLDPDETASDSNIGYQLGVETGYEFDNGLGLSFGYQASFVELETYYDVDVDARFSNLYVGAKYKF